MRISSLLGVTAFPTLFLGCSLLFDLKSTQCSTYSDCDALGGNFVGLQCDQGLCTACGSSKACEARGPGYVCEKPKSKPLAICQYHQEADQGDAGPQVECDTNQDCFDKHATKWICRDHSCLNLVTPECPVVLQPDNLVKTDPIIIGAYSAINAASPETGPITLNYNLALQDFTDTVGGLTGNADGTRRGFVAVVCEGRPDAQAPLENSLHHLIDVVKVPGIVASLYTDSLRQAFETKGRPNHVFFIDPLYADSTLTTQSNNGLLWFILGEWRDLAKSYVKLTERAEQFQRNNGAKNDLRVALIEGSLTAQKDTAQVLLADAQNSLRINDKPVLDDANTDNFLLLELPADFATNTASIANTIKALGDFQPHVIVLTAGTEFVTKVIPSLEANWVDETQAGQIRPFYVLSPDVAGDSAPLTKATYDKVLGRSAGINFAGYADRTLYNAYRTNFQAHFGSSSFQADWENFYDSMYYMAYSFAAAGNPAVLDGDSLAQGMQRLTSVTGTSYDVGPASISKVLAALLSPGNKINLRGTMGPSDFYPGTGSRVVEGSVWCAKPGQAPSFNVLRLNDNDELSGTFGCFANF